MKWCNEQCPKYSKNLWSSEDDEELLQVVRSGDLCDNWDLIAERLNTNRTAFQCFERHTFLKQMDRERRLQTPTLYFCIIH